MPTLAVVVPTYDRRDLLAATLDSIEGQRRPADQVVVASDGSRDGTDELVRARGLRLVRTDRLGAAGARNAGWRSTTAEIVAFIDDDCVAHPNWLGSLERCFAGDGVGLVQGRTEPAGPVGPLDRSVRVTSERGLYESCNIAYQRRALDEVGGFDESFGRQFASRGGGQSQGGGSGFGEDTDLAWRVRRAGWAATFCPEALVHHAVFPGSVLDSLREEWRRRRFPWLVREIPELGPLLPGGSVWLRRQSPLAQLALIALLLTVPTKGRSLVGVWPYALWLARNTAGLPGAFHQGARDAVGSVALALGSVEHRRPVL